MRKMRGAFFPLSKVCSNQLILADNYVQGSLLSLLYDEEQNLDRVLPFHTMLIMLCGLPQDQELSQ
jgi:hypothetical protein